MSRLRDRRTLAALLVGIGVIVAVLVAIVASPGDEGDGSASRIEPVIVPPLPADLRGTRFPARGKEAGFSDSAWVHYGLGGKYDLGVSPEAEAAWARGAGATLQRIGFDWRQVEPEDGRIDQGYVDRVTAFVDRFEAAGGQVVVFLFAAPVWAQEPDACGPGDCIAPPADLRAWRRFVRLAARTFPRAAAFEIWNEPNLSLFWRPKPDPGAYARLATAAVKELDQVAPRAKVLVGALAGVRDGEETIAPGRFLREAAGRGLTTGFDAVSWHVYPTQAGGDVPPPRSDPGVQFVLDDVRNGVRLYDPQVRTWVTETGVTRTGRDYGVSAAEQAIGLLRLYRFLSRQPDVEAVFVHQLVESLPSPPDSPERGFGVVRPLARERQAPTPAWCALRSVAADPGSGPLDGACVS